MRLIDADAILNRAEESFKNAGLHGEDYRKFKKWFRKAPTIDAVDVVRCKDCRYYNNDYMGEWCGRHQAPVWVKEDDFCSWARMKGGDTE